MRFVCTFHYLHFDEFWEHDIIIWLFISDDVFLLKASREFIRDDLMSFIQGNNKDGRDILIRFPPLLSLKMITSVIEMMIRVGRSKCWSMMVTGKQMGKTWMSANNKNLKSSEKQSKLRRIKIMMIIIIAIIAVIIIITVSVHQGALLDAGQLHHIHTIRRWSDKNIIIIIIIIIVPLLSSSSSLSSPLLSLSLYYFPGEIIVIVTTMEEVLNMKLDKYCGSQGSSRITAEGNCKVRLM